MKILGRFSRFASVSSSWLISMLELASGRFARVFLVALARFLRS